VLLRPYSDNVTITVLWDVENFDTVRLISYNSSAYIPYRKQLKIHHKQSLPLRGKYKHAFLYSYSSSLETTPPPPTKTHRTEKQTEIKNIRSILLMAFQDRKAPQAFTRRAVSDKGQRFAARPLQANRHASQIYKSSETDSKPNL
jgi:hypothetical protein